MHRVLRRIPKWRGYASFRFLFKVLVNFQKAGGISCSSSLSYTLLLAFIPFSISIASISSWLPISNAIINDVQMYFLVNLFLSLELRFMLYFNSHLITPIVYQF